MRSWRRRGRRQSRRRPRVADSPRCAEGHHGQPHRFARSVDATPTPPDAPVTSRTEPSSRPAGGRIAPLRQGLPCGLEYQGRAGHLLHATIRWEWAPCWLRDHSRCPRPAPPRERRDPHRSPTPGLSTPAPTASTSPTPSQTGCGGTAWPGRSPQPESRPRFRAAKSMPSDLAAAGLRVGNPHVDLADGAARRRQPGSRPAGAGRRARSSACRDRRGHAAGLGDRDHSKEPLIDMQMMRIPTVWTVDLVALLFGMGMYAMFAFVPQFLQTPEVAGWARPERSRSPA